MHLQPAENADTWRGALTAFALAAMLIGLFTLFALAFDGELRIPEVIQRQFASDDGANREADAAPVEKTGSAKTEPDHAESKKPDSKKAEQDDAELPASPGRDALGRAGARARPESRATSGSRATSAASTEPTDNSGSTAGAPPASAAEALNQVLKAYKPEPGRTATVSITSLGHIRPQGSGAPTVFDGLPARAVSQATLVTTGIPRDGSAASF